MSAINVDIINQRRAQKKREPIVASDERDDRGSELDFRSIEENQLKADASWGRLYIDGFPGESGIQYFRANFGSVPPSHRVKFVLDDSTSMTYCNSDDKNNDDHENEEVNEVEKSSTPRSDQFDSDTIIVVKRGSCSFAEKAKRAQATGAGGLLIINNEVRSEGSSYCNLFFFDPYRARLLFPLS